MARFQVNESRTSYGSLGRRLLPLAVFALLLVLFLYGTTSLSRGNEARQRQALENALSHAITSCYAMEGRYPESLDYIKSHYGLIFDESRFYVDYRVEAANLYPDVTILLKEAAR